MPEVYVTPVTRDYADELAVTLPVGTSVRFHSHWNHPEWARVEGGWQLIHRDNEPGMPDHPTRANSRMAGFMRTNPFTIIMPEGNNIIDKLEAYNA